MVASEKFQSTYNSKQLKKKKKLYYKSFSYSLTVKHIQLYIFHLQNFLSSLLFLQSSKLAYKGYVWKVPVGK